MPKMSDSALRALLAAEKADSLAASQSGKLSQDRANSMDYYLGNMTKDMPAQPGRSAAVSSDVADAVDGAMPPLLEMFCGSDEVVRFEPVGPEDEEAAQQETDYVNHVFMQKNDGFTVISTMLKDALLQKVGIVKVWWEETERQERETYLDLAEDQFALLAQDVLASDGSLEIIEHTAKPDGAHDVTIQRTKKIKQAKVMGVPPEEFGIERNARTIRECNYCFHKIVTKTEADLIAEGFDESQVKKLPSHTLLNNSEEQSRDTVDEEYWAQSGENSGTRVVEITEHYIRIDYEGNGKACLYKITTAGGQDDILKRDGEPDVEEFDSIPFAAAIPIPVPHRFFGRSLADLAMPTQRINTALLRGALDAQYIANNPRVVIAESHAGPNTIDDILVSRPNQVVRVKQPGGIEYQKSPDVSAANFELMSYMDNKLELRTGVTRQSQGVDADALQNQSATAVNHVFNASQARITLIARNIAVGVRDMFALLHQVIRKHGEEAQTVRLRNKWVQVDPRQWKTRDDMTINVGLGTGGKSERFAQTMALANFQKELVLGGKTNIVDDQKLFNSASEVSKLLGHRNPDKFFNDPSEKGPDGQLLHPPPPPRPDPKLAEIQLKAELGEKELQAKAQIETLQANADIATQDRKTAAEIAQNERKADRDERLALIEHAAKMEEHRAETARKAELHKQTMDRESSKFAMDTHHKTMDANSRLAERGMKANEDGSAAIEPAVKGALEQLAQRLDHVAKLASAPRKSTLVRDPKTGKATHAVHEVVQ